MVEEPFQIRPGQTHESRFRFVLYDGEIGEPEIRGLGERPWGEAP
jgi:hypothetical protein